MVLGGHGDDMVPVRSHCHVGGVPVEKLIKPDRLDAIEKRVRGAGGEIMNLMKTGSAFYSPAAAAIQMAEAYLFDKKQILPCAALLEGEYGVNGFFVGVPVQIGGGGVEKVIEVELSDGERKQLQGSVEHVRELVERVGKVSDAGLSGGCDERSRVSGQGAAEEIRGRGSARARGRQPGGRGQGGARAGRQLRHQGADPRRRARQGRRRQGVPQPGGSRGLRPRPARPQAGHAPDRAGGARGETAARRGGERHRPRALPGDGRRPRHRPSGDDGVGRGRRRDRGGGGALAGEDPAREHRPGRRAAAVSGPQARLRHRHPEGSRWARR